MFIFPSILYGSMDKSILTFGLGMLVMGIAIGIMLGNILGYGAHGQTIEQYSPATGYVYFFDISQLAAVQEHNTANPNQPVNLFESLRSLFTTPSQQ